ncbi:MAG: hypothetical protein DRP76_03540, partial [Candidatus Omnitrophota bacterium]
EQKSELMEQQSLIEGYIKQKKIEEEGKNWREYLNKVGGDLSVTTEICMELRTDPENRYYISGDKEIDKAFDALSELQEAIKLGLGMIKAETEIDKCIKEVQTNISERYYNVDRGYTTNNIETYKNQISGKLSSIKTLLEGSEEEYNTKKAEISSKQAELKRNGVVIEQMKGTLQEYEKRVLRVRGEEVTEKREIYNEARELYNIAEQDYKEAQQDYIEKLQELQEATKIMDEKRLRYEKALGIYEYAVSEYIYSKSKEGCETPRSSEIENKRDARDEYERVKNIYDDVVKRYEEEEAKVNQIKRYKEILEEDSQIREKEEEYKELLKRYIRISKAEEELRKDIDQFENEMIEAKDKYQKLKDRFFSTGGDEKRRDRILYYMLYNNRYNSGDVKEMGRKLRNGGSLTGDDKYVYDNITYVKNGANAWKEKIKNEEKEEEHMSNAKKFAAIAAEYAAIAGFWNPWAWAAAAIYAGLAAYEYAEASKYRSHKEDNIKTFNYNMNRKNAFQNEIKRARKDLIEKQQRFRQFAAAKDVTEVKNILLSYYKYLQIKDLDYLTENEEPDKYNITSLKGDTPITIPPVDATSTAQQYAGYNLYQVADGLGNWFKNKANKLWRSILDNANKKGYKYEEMLKMQEAVLKEVQEYAGETKELGRDNEGYVEITKQLLEIGEEAYNKAIADEQEIQEYKWDLKEQGYRDERAKWGDTMVLIIERGKKQWGNMEARYLREWRGWYQKVKQAKEEKEEEFAEAEKQMRKDRDMWLKDVIEKGVKYRKTEIQKMIEDSIQRSRQKVKIKDIAITLPDGRKIARDIIEEMRPEEISQTLIQAARGIDITFSIDKLRDIEYNNKASEQYQAKAEYYTAEMEKIGKLKLMEQMKEEIEEMEKEYEEALKEMEISIREGFEDTFYEKGFSIGKGRYEREIIVDSTLIGGDEYKTQSISAYKEWGKYDIRYKYISPKEAEGMSSYEIELYTQVAMKNISEEFNKKQEELVKHQGECPEFNDKGEITKRGSGESGRLINALVEAEKEKAEGEAKANQPFYKKGILPGIKISLSSIAKIGLSFIPGGQLAALAISVAETAVDLARGAISWGQAGLNMVTSAVSAGVSWLGDIASKAVDGIVSAATTVGKVTANVVRSAVNAVGNVIN